MAMRRGGRYMDADDEANLREALGVLTGGEDEGQTLERGEMLAGLYRPDTAVRSGHLYGRAVAELSAALVLYRREQAVFPSAQPVLRPVGAGMEALEEYFGTGTSGVRGSGVVCRACHVVVAGAGRVVHAGWHVRQAEELDRLRAEVERLRGMP